jgi:hypothetical protein
MKEVEEKGEEVKRRHKDDGACVRVGKEGKEGQMIRKRVQGECQRG